MDEYKEHVENRNNLANKLKNLQQSKIEVNKKMAKIKNQILMYQNQQDNVAGIVDVKQYVELKNLDAQLKKQVKNTKRKIKILNFKFQKAEKFLKNYAYENPEINQMEYDQDPMEDEMYEQQGDEQY